MNKSLREHYLRKNWLKLVHSGEDFIDKLESLIRIAENEIQFQTYIFEPDETGQRILRALIDAAVNRKIKVFILVDAYGTKNFKSTQIAELKRAGINFRFFGKFYSRGSFHIGRRLHRKVVVADGKIAIVGGINISNKYTDQKESPAWLDFAVQVEGETARRLHLICRKRWMNIRFKSFPKKIRDGIVDPQYGSENGAFVKVSQNDYINGKYEISKTYRNQISKSRESVTIVGGYFLPGGRMRRILKDAITRGVQIKIIVSETSDVKLVLQARRYLYSWLLRNDIKIYEYQPSNVHGKVLICDSVFTSIGSYDLNNLSTYSNIELNLDIYDENFSGTFQDFLNNIIIEKCHLVTENDFKKRHNQLNAFVNWISYQVVKTFFVLSILFSKKDE